VCKAARAPQVFPSEGHNIADIGFTFDNTNQVFDWPPFSVLSQPATSTLDLETAVALSLFTDRIADPSYVGDARGSWQDTYAGISGSRLWMLDRSTTIGVLQRAKDYCNEALAWLISDSVAGSVNVTTWWNSTTALGIKVEVFAPKQTTPRTFFYSLYWQGV
jgi:phage gp46-like protein